MPLVTHTRHDPIAHGLSYTNSDINACLHATLYGTLKVHVWDGTVTDSTDMHDQHNDHRMSAAMHVAVVGHWNGEVTAMKAFGIKGLCATFVHQVGPSVASWLL